MDSCDSLLVMKKNAHLKHCALISLDFSNAKGCVHFLYSLWIKHLILGDVNT